MDRTPPLNTANERDLHNAYREYYNRLYFYAKRFLRDSEAAKDTVHDIFYVLYSKPLLFDSSSSLRSFLYISTYNACLDRLKSSAVRKRYAENIHINPTETDRNYLDSRIEDEVLWEVFQAIEQLPEECKKIFKLSYMENLSIEQVAEALKISTHTVKSQRARAKKLLKDKLKYLYMFVSLYG